MLARDRVAVFAWHVSGVQHPQRAGSEDRLANAAWRMDRGGGCVCRDGARDRFTCSAASWQAWNDEFLVISARGGVARRMRRATSSIPPRWPTPPRRQRCGSPRMLFGRAVAVLMLALGSAYRHRRSRLNCALAAFVQLARAAFLQYPKIVRTPSPCSSAGGVRLRAGPAGGLGVLTAVGVPLPARPRALSASALPCSWLTAREVAPRRGALGGGHGGTALPCLAPHWCSRRCRRPGSSICASAPNSPGRSRPDTQPRRPSFEIDGRRLVGVTEAAPRRGSRIRCDGSSRCRSASGEVRTELQAAAADRRAATAASSRSPTSRPRRCAAGGGSVGGYAEHR
jgi:hypothetical protein